MRMETKTKGRKPRAQVWWPVPLRTAAIEKARRMQPSQSGGKWYPATSAACTILLSGGTTFVTRAQAEAVLAEVAS